MNEKIEKDDDELEKEIDEEKDLNIVSRALVRRRDAFSKLKSRMTKGMGIKLTRMRG